MTRDEQSPSPAARAETAREDPGVDRAWVVAAMKAIEGLTAGEASFTGHPIVDCVAQLRASASATEAALRAECEALAVKWERIYNAPVNRGDLFAAELRSVLARIRKETPDHE